MLNLNQVYHGDCLEVMNDIDDKSIDMILCDLPYGNQIAKWDFQIDLGLLWVRYKRIIKDNGVICLTSKQPFTTVLGYSNLTWLRYDLIWKKSIGGEFLNANRKPLPRHESILVFYDKLPVYNPQMTTGISYRTTRGSVGKAVTKDTTVSGYETINSGLRYPISILEFNNDTGLHPTQKPVKLFEYLIKTYTNEGDLILDNCAGSGTTGIAARNLNRNFILIEKELEYVEIIKERLNEPYQKQLLT